MRLTRKGKRRLIIVLAVMAMAGAAVVAFVGVRDVHRSRLAAEARTSGLAAFGEGAYREALDALRYPLARNPSDVEVLLAIAECHARLPEEGPQYILAATAAYRAALKYDPENLRGLEGLLRLYRLRDDLGRLEGIAGRILAIVPDHVDAWSAKTVIAFRRQDFDEVLADSARLIELEPQALAWRLLHMKALEGQGEDPQTILALCDQWIAAGTIDGRFRLLKAEFLVGLGRLEESRAEILAAADAGATAPEILTAMLRVLEGLDLARACEGLIERTQQRFPKAAWVYEIATRQHWRELRETAALEELAEADRALGGLTPPLERWRALLLARAGRSSAARAALERLRQETEGLEPAERDAMRAGARAIEAILEAGSHPDRATLDVCEHALALDRGETAFQMLLAETYQKTAQHELALAVLAQAARQDPTCRAIQVGRARSLLAVDRPAPAFDALSAVLRAAPDAGMGVYRLLARAWLELGEAGSSVHLNDSRRGEQFNLRGLLEAMHAQAPHDAEVAGMLMEVQLRDRRPDEAQALVEAALADPAAPADLLIALADVSARRGRDDGHRLLGRARAVAGATLAVQEAEARALALSGRMDEAVRHLEAARRAAPAGEREARARRAELRLRLAAGDPEALPDLRQWLDEAPDAPRAARFVLDRPRAWTDRALIEHAIDVLHDHMGASSPRVLLAEAAALDRYDGDDPAAISRAVSKVAMVLERAPQSKAALVRMASLLLRGDDPRPDQAIRHLKRAVAIYGRDLDLSARLVRLLQDQGDYETAAAYLSQMAANCRAAPGFAAVEEDLLRTQGDLPRLVRRLEERVNEDSSEAEQLELARLEAQTGHRDAAAAIYERLVANPACSERALMRAARFQAVAGRFDQGAALIESFSPASGRAVTERRLGRYDLAAGRLEEAGQHLDRARELDRNDAATWAAITDLQVARGETAQARAAALTALKLDPGNAALRATLAVVSMGQDEASRRAAVAQITETNGANPALLPTILLHDRLLGPDAPAPTEADLARARRLVHDHPAFPPAWRVAIDVFARASRLEEALTLARRALTRLPNEAAPAERATRLLLGLAQPEAALEMARTWRARTLRDPLAAEVMIASILLDLDRPSEAARGLDEQAVRRIWNERSVHPDRLEVYLALLIESGRRDRAAEWMETLLEESPGWWGGALDLAGRLEGEDALFLVSRLDRGPRAAPAERLRLAEAWRRLAAEGEVISGWRRARELAESVTEPALATEAMILRASIATGSGDLDEAEALYRGVLEKDPQDLIALNNLAFVLVLTEDRCEEAVTLARRALVLAADNPEVLDTLAAALLCAGDQGEAERRIGQALEGDPDNPSYLLLQARIRHAMGREPDARRSLDRAERAMQARGGAGNDLREQLAATRRLLES